MPFLANLKVMAEVEFQLKSSLLKGPSYCPRLNSSARFKGNLSELHLTFNVFARSVLSLSDFK